MQSYPKKPCKFCGRTNHFPFACYLNPKNRQKIKPNKKYEKAWIQTKNDWIKKNPPPINGRFWRCYLQISPQCIHKMDKSRLTLDHVISRSRDPSKRFSVDNLKPACWYCNGLKGSRTIEALEDQFGKKII